jgi:hypothetical protein
MDLKNDRMAELYEKYMSFMEVMLEDYQLLEIASVMQVQSLSIYRSTMSDSDYNKIVDAISDKRNQIKTFSQGNSLQ